MTALTEQEVIARQAMQIAELQKQLRIDAESFRIIHMVLYGIGGPLNDNKYGYTKEQLGPFRAIAREIAL